MATLTTLRADLRLDLNDPSGAQERFADADLDRAITRALTELSRALPYVQEATLRTTAGSRRVDLSGSEPASGTWRRWSGRRERIRVGGGASSWRRISRA